MKSKLLLLIAFVVFSSNLTSAQALYAESISTPDGSINFLIGVSPSSIQTVTRSDNSTYCTVKLVLINDEKAQAFDWADYKVYVLTKDGKIGYNYTTTADGGEFDCTYELKPGESKTQLLCYARTFAQADIDRIWLVMSDEISFELVLTE
jgi:hypothetical protein